MEMRTPFTNKKINIWLGKAVKSMWQLIKPTSKWISSALCCGPIWCQQPFSYFQNMNYQITDLKLQLENESAPTNKMIPHSSQDNFFGKKNSDPRETFVNRLLQNNCMDKTEDNHYVVIKAFYHTHPWQGRSIDKLPKTSHRRRELKALTL